MKLVKLGASSPYYLSWYYSRRPDVSALSYAEHKAALDFDAFSWADFWGEALRPLGYEVLEISSNAKSLQLAWARENGFLVSDESQLLDISLEQIRRFRPDVLFVEDFTGISYEWLTELRIICPSIKMVMGWCGAPNSRAPVFAACDLILSCIPELVEDFKNRGHRSFHLNHAFDPRILSRIDLATEPTIDFSFVGQILRMNRYHGEREKILRALSKHFDISIFSPAFDLGLLDEFKAIAKRGVYFSANGLKDLGVPTFLLERIPGFRKGLKWENLPEKVLIPELRRFLKPPVFGLEMFQTLRNSQVTFNSHIDASPFSASNMRLFEAAGVGACLVTDWKKNLKDLFNPEEEVVTYLSVEECIEKVRWLLDHPKERKRIGNCAQARVLAQHTFASRANTLDKHILDFLKG